MDGCTPALFDDVHLGRVIAVSACQAIALLERSDSAASDRDLPLEMGTLVKMRTQSLDRVRHGDRTEGTATEFGGFR